MKNKILCVVLMSVLGHLSCMAVPSLLIHLTDSTESVCALNKEPKMTFTEKAMTLTAVDGIVGQWDFTDVESWNFADVKVVADVNPVNVEKARIRIEDSMITIAGVNADEIAVYDAGGRSSVQVPDSTDGQISINIDGLPQGTYILKAGDSSIKFLVK